MDGIMDEKELEDLLAMELEERWRELLNDADDAIKQEEERTKTNLTPKTDQDRAEEK